MMGNVRHALKLRRHFQLQLQVCRLDAGMANEVLQTQYRKHTLLPLTAAVFGGLLLGRHGGNMRPPRPLLRAAFSWSMMLIRGLM